MRSARIAFSIATGAIVALPLGLSGVDAANAATIVVDSLPAATLEGGLTACITLGCTGAFGQSANTGQGTADSFTNGAELFVPSGTTTFHTVTDFVNGIQVVGNNPLSFAVGAAGNLSTVNAAGTPSPSMSVTMVSPEGLVEGVLGSSGYSQFLLAYQFEVVSLHGAPGSVNVTVNSVGSVSGAAAPNKGGLSVNAEAQFVIPGTGLDDVAQACFSSAGNCSFTAGAGFLSGVSGNSETGGFDESGSYAVNLDEIYTVDLNELVNCSGASAACSASIDPAITVPAGDELLLSQGFGNGAVTPSVPEPGTLGVLGVALLGLATVRRRRG